MTPVYYEGVAQLLVQSLAKAIYSLIVLKEPLISNDIMNQIVLQYLSLERVGAISQFWRCLGINI